MLHITHQQKAANQNIYEVIMSSQRTRTTIASTDSGRKDLSLTPGGNASSTAFLENNIDTSQKTENCDSI